MASEMEITKVGHYKILSKLGSGGMGTVYLAQDEKLDRTVALKILPLEVASNPDRLRRFVQEAKAASALDHPNVAHIYEIGEAEGIWFIAMQYVEGQTLDARSKEHALESMEIVDIAIQAADALDAAGSKGIVHRDIKAANLMITPRGQVKVLDFGLAKIESKDTTSDSSKLDTATGTTPGMILGTIGYMSPEQALGKVLDHRSDIYSLGVVLYQLATGRLPFSGTSPSDTLAKILHSQPDAIARFNYSIDSELDRIIRKSMEKDPERRYQSARELLIDLKNLKRDTQSGAVVGGVRATKHRNWAPVALATVAILALAVGGVYFFTSRNRSEIRSLAVLPFMNSNPDPANEWLSDGMTETTIKSLSRIPDLRVMARSTVDRYKTKTLNPQEAGRELKVDAVLTGTISQQGEDLVIGAELVNVKDGSLIWGEDYRNKMPNLSSVQRKISEQISEELRSKLTGEQKREMTRQFTAAPEAYELYLRGRYFWSKRSPEALQQAIQYFEEAIAKDPSFAAAYTGLADCYVVRSSPFSREIRLARGRAAANKALELDPELAEAYVSLGASKELEFKWREAMDLYRKAIQLNPNYATAHQWLGEILSVLGRTEEGLVETYRAMELDPLSRVVNFSLGNQLYFARKYDEAVRQFRRAIELEPIDPAIREGYMVVLIAKKEYLQAIKEYEKSSQIAGKYEQETAGIEAVRKAYLSEGEKGFWKQKLEFDLQAMKSREESPYNIACDYSMLGQKDRAFEWLDRAVSMYDPNLDSLRVDPLLDGIRSDSRFREYVRRMNLL